MTTLAEIEAAADTLPPEEQKELFLYLALRLKENGPKIQPRELDQNQIRNWIIDDEAEMRRLVGEG